MRESVCCARGVDVGGLLMVYGFEMLIVSERGVDSAVLCDGS